MYPESAVNLRPGVHLVLVPFKPLDLQWVTSAFSTGELTQCVSFGGWHVLCWRPWGWHGMVLGTLVPHWGPGIIVLVGQRAPGPGSWHPSPPQFGEVGTEPSRRVQASCSPITPMGGMVAVPTVGPWA